MQYERSATTNYIKVGKLVHCYAQANITNVGSGTELHLRGLPFTPIAKRFSLFAHLGNKFARGVYIPEDNEITFVDEDGTGFSSTKLNLGIYTVSFSYFTEE